MSLKQYAKFQPKVIQMILNSYAKQRLAHAYLFEGEKGTKKKEIALEFAKLLYCESEDKTCDQCINCLRIEHNNHPNVLLITPENNTIKKEQIIYLQQEYTKTTLEVGPKVYIIEDIDKMSINASNSILKFIEEPQKDTYTILITDNLHQILPTIISRCQVLNFQPIPQSEVYEYLINKGIENGVASVCSHLTNDVDHALSIASDESIKDIIELVRTVVKGILSKSDNPVVIVDKSPVDIYTKKNLIDYFLDILLLFVRDIKKIENNNDNVVFINDEPFIKNNLKNMDSSKINRNIELILKAKIGLEYNANTTLLIDHLLINLL